MHAAQDRVAMAMRDIESPIERADRQLEAFKRDLADAKTPADKAAQALERYEQNLRQQQQAQERAALGIRDYKAILREMESPAAKVERQVEELARAMKHQGVAADVAAKHLEDYRQHLTRAQGSTRSLKDSVGEVVPVFGRATSLWATGGPLLLGAAAAAGAAAIAYRTIGTAVNFTYERMQKLDQRLDKAKALGMELRDLDKFTYAADRGAGLSEDKAIGALQKFQKGIGEASVQGDGKAADALKQLGLGLNDIKDVSPLKPSANR